MLIDYIIGPKARAATRWLSSTADTKVALPKATSAEGEALNVGLERVAFWWSMAPRAWATGLLCELVTRISRGPRSGLPIRGEDLRTSVMTAIVGVLVLGVASLLVSFRVLHLRKQIIDRLAESSAAETKARSRELLEAIMKGVHEAVGLRRGDIVWDMDGKKLVFHANPARDVFVFVDTATGQEVEVHTGGGSIWEMVKRVAAGKGAAS